MLHLKEEINNYWFEEKRNTTVSAMILIDVIVLNIALPIT